MRILFIHQNFPAQFRNLAKYLVATGKHELLALKQPPSAEFDGVGVASYKFLRNPEPNTHPLLKEMETKVLRGEAVADAVRRLKTKGYTPDVIVAHPSWGEVLFIKDVWPKIKLICYFEYYYSAVGQDFDFDPEFRESTFTGLARLRLKNTTMQQALEIADAGWAPTNWQKKTFPKWAHSKIDVIHEGIDTDYFRPNAQASFNIANKHINLTRQHEVITYAARALEPVRGFHVFMRALPDLLARRPNAHVVIMGHEKASYGPEPGGNSSWLEKMLSEVGADLDPERVHVVGFLAKEQYRAVMQVSKAHVYLTYPFILSWSLLEAMACGAPIVASNTAPIKEFIKDGKTGFLFDFFNTTELVEAVIKQLDAKQNRIDETTWAARDLIANDFAQTVCVEGLLKLIESESNH
ncbi:glycosyltransferase [Nitrosomonas ureae]|uniref:Glycosyltransferase involved in cell wall bisynthesis n=1 Tax=Nitrosomonas ureae TaxID=44577 RepID=A0A1H5UJJ2_9PROT|nr:glycosyltransferase [Nitrosomonas ureae]SEF74571.1 Glycosyltransferase involved in cell wall bisynthesis [Nitrosomonas ureae]